MGQKQAEEAHVGDFIPEIHSTLSKFVSTRTKMPIFVSITLIHHLSHAVITSN